jgi:hypothetical protein
LCRIYAFQVLALLGLAYTSAPLIAGIQNMTPVFTFIIGVVFRYTHSNSFSFLKTFMLSQRTQSRFRCIYEEFGMVLNSLAV